MGTGKGCSNGINTKVGTYGWNVVLPDRSCLVACVTLHAILWSIESAKLPAAVALNR